MNEPRITHTNRGTHMTTTNRFAEALQYAATIHSEQLRKCTSIPYISHLLAVSALVLEHGGSEDESIAALLHDAVEDAGGKARLEDIIQKFGRNVGDIVLSCSDADTFPKPPWRERKEKYIAHLKESNPSVLLVVAADKLHNATTILRDVREHGEKVWDRFKVNKETSVWFYREVTKALKARKVERLGSILKDLENAVSEMDTPAQRN